MGLAPEQVDRMTPSAVDDLWRLWLLRHPRQESSAWLDDAPDDSLVAELRAAERLA